MKKLIISVLLFSDVCGCAPLFCSCSSAQNIDDFIEVLPLNKNVISKNKIGSFAFRLKDYVKNDVDVSIVDVENPKALTLPTKKIKPVGKIIDLNVNFVEKQTINTKIEFGLKFVFTNLQTNKKYYSVVNNLSITYQEENELEAWCNNYAEKENANFLSSLTMSEHDYYEDYCSNFFCTSGAEACINWGHHPAWPEWSRPLHDGKGNTSALDNGGLVMGDFSYPGMEAYYRHTKLSDYKFLDEALKLSTVGNVGKTVYHGFEEDESDLMEFIKNVTGLSMDDPVESWNDEICKRFIGKEYTDWSYLATSFDRAYSYDWCLGSSYNTVPFFEITLDSDVYGAYISYSRRTWYGLYLSRPENYQLLINRKAKIKVTDVELVPPEEGKHTNNILVLKVKVSKQDI